MSDDPSPDTTADEEPDARRVRPFADVLRDINYGETHDELSIALRDLLAACEDTGRPGKLTLTLAVKPMAGGRAAGNRSTQVTITDSIIVKAPERPRATSVFFLDAEANLRRDNPAQPQIPGILAPVANPRTAPTPINREAQA